MNDLLGTVKGKGSNALYKGEEKGDDGHDEEQGFTPPPSAAETEMQDFFSKVEDVKKDMAEIRSLQKEITTIHEKSKTIVKSKEMQKQREVMQVRAGGCTDAVPARHANLDSLAQSQHGALGRWHCPCAMRPLRTRK